MLSDLDGELLCSWMGDDDNDLIHERRTAVVYHTACLKTCVVW